MHSDKIMVKIFFFSLSLYNYSYQLIFLYKKNGIWIHHDSFTEMYNIVHSFMHG